MTAPTNVTFVSGTTITSDWLNGINDTTIDYNSSKFISVKDAAFGAVGDGITDDTVALQAAIDANVPIHIPAGTYKYTSLTGLDRDGLTLIGDGSANTVLKYSGTAEALLLGNTSAFRQNITLRGFTVEGNANTTYLIKARALARCQWQDINVREANPTTGVGFLFQGCMLNRFESLVCSQDLQAMTNAPEEGMQLQSLSPFGACSNNTFINTYIEGAGNVANTIEIGIRITDGDQNVFIGGSPESCGTWGLLVSATSRYNSFIGVGFENTGADGGDFADGGIHTSFQNCYSVLKAVFQGRSAILVGGFFERIQIDVGALRTRIKNLTINNWATGLGGIFDSGTGTETENIYDADLSAFITDIKPRFLAYVPATQVNVTGAGTLATVAFSEIYDDAGNFVSNTFTAPVTGRYQLNAVVSFDDLSTAATLSELQIVTSNRTYLTQKGLNPKAGGLQDSISISVIADMDAGDTAQVKVRVSGMAGDTADVIGNGTTMWTTFSGCRV